MVDPSASANPSLSETTTSPMNDADPYTTGTLGSGPSPNSYNPSMTNPLKNNYQMGYNPAGMGTRTVPSAGPSSVGQYAAPTALQDNLTTDLIAGPYRIGGLLRAGQLSAVSGNLALASLVNVATTGWVLNQLMQRDSPLDPFGLLISALVQLSAGAFTVAQPITKPAQ